MTMRDHGVDISSIRAPLFVPANRPERFEKAAQSGADAVILDLEDAVAIDAKDTARAALRCDFTDLPIIVRINAAGSSAYDEDLAAVAALCPDAVMIPKAEDPEQLETVAKSVSCPVIALIETAKGLAWARKIAATPSVLRLAFGSIDFCADLGCAHSRQILAPVRFELVLASRLCGIAAPLDGVTVQLDDLSITQEDATHARDMGMTGKLCIHPKQITPVLSAFAPSDTEIAWARRIILSGDGAVQIDGAMVDEPVRRKARAILRAAQQDL
jgi:citrate lyase subunit beta / citryl-CoA lyase